MNNFMNHYETLNVANTASLDEIRGSYHTLCKIFHPDLNPNMQDGLLMIEELTNAYEVLKDSNSRQDYDVKYLIEMRRKSSRPSVSVAPVAPVLEKLPELPKAVIEKKEAIIQANEKLIEFSRRSRESSKEDSGLGSKIVAAVAVIAVLGGLALSLSTPNSVVSRLRLTSPIAKPNYVRPIMAPNQTPFPESTSYLSGYEIRNNQGSSSLHVDNTKNDNDVYLKLLSVENKKLAVVRHVLIKGKTDFKIENLSAGQYEIQYLDLVAGLAGRSVVFSVSEEKTAFGVKSSSLGVKLKTTANGVMGVEDVSIDEFNSLASL